MKKRKENKMKTVKLKDGRVIKVVYPEEIVVRCHEKYLNFSGYFPFRFYQAVPLNNLAPGSPLPSTKKRREPFPSWRPG